MVGKGVKQVKGDFQVVEQIEIVIFFEMVLFLFLTDKRDLFEWDFLG